jgi:hypothetical protein
MVDEKIEKSKTNERDDVHDDLGSIPTTVSLMLGKKLDCLPNV